MDDQQARDQMIEGLKVAMLGTTDGDFIDPNSDIPAGEMFRLAAEYLAALPVAPEQPTQASEDALKLAAVREFLSHPEHTGRRLVLDGETWEHPLVSSPSVETVTPNRETIIREVLDWIERGFNHEVQFIDDAREHFGVSS